MTALDYPHITRIAGDVARLDRFPRIRVAQIAADHIGNGWLLRKSSANTRTLTAAEVQAALGYYYDHREEIDAELAAIAADSPVSFSVTNSTAPSANKSAISNSSPKQPSGRIGWGR